MYGKIMNFIAPARHMQTFGRGTVDYAIKLPKQSEAHHNRDSSASRSERELNATAQSTPKTTTLPTGGVTGVDRTRQAWNERRQHRRTGQRINDTAVGPVDGEVEEGNLSTSYPTLQKLLKQPSGFMDTT